MAEHKERIYESKGNVRSCTEYENTRNIHSSTEYEDKRNTRGSIDFDFDFLFCQSIDSMSLHIKEEFETLEKETKKKLVLKIVECMDKEDSSPATILHDLLSEISQVKAKHSKSNIEQEYIEYQDDTELTVSQVLQACPSIKSINTVKNRVRANKLVGFTDNKIMKLPAWQFHNGSVLHGLEKVISFIGTNGIPAVRALETPMERYEGKSAYEYLREGDLDTAILIIKLICEGNR